MKSKIFTGTVMHARLAPIRHEFEYQIYWYAFDLDELHEIEKTVPLFGYNKIRPVSLFDKDYLTSGPGSIKEKLLAFLDHAQCGDGITRIELITSARYLNYVFNPVSFYYCYRADGSVRCTVAEVNNTFHERHLYVLDEERRSEPRFITRYTVPKSFHVSPFNDMEGEYDFHFSSTESFLDIRINILREGDKSFISRMWGHARPLSTLNLLKVFVQFPLTALMTIPRIYWQAAKLHYMRGMPVISKPHPSSSFTIKVAPPMWKERLGRFISRKVLSHIEDGYLTVVDPHGRRESFGDSRSSLRAELTLRSYAVYDKVVSHGGIGFGESFVDGDWETNDLAAVLKILFSNSKTSDDRYFNLLRPIRFLNRIQHWFRKNTLRGSRKNIEAHYDLSNDLFKLFLDPSMMYSSGIYARPESTLEEAQKLKVDTLIQKAHIEHNHKVLEIGSGWGTFAIEAARQRGCHVRSVTLSSEQLALATKRATLAGISEKVHFDLVDYRHVSGKYDRIVSIEMLEAVGKEYLGSFFESCDRLLAPNGLVVLQVIVTPESYYDVYCKRQDWIQKHVFPGSHIPCLTALMKAIKKHSSFMVEDIENIGPHYARTLADWRDRFDEKGAEVSALGFDDRFKKLWRFYLASCEAEFATRWLGVYQIVLTRINNKYLIQKDGERTQHHTLLHAVGRAA